MDHRISQRKFRLNIVLFSPSGEILLKRCYAGWKNRDCKVASLF